MRAPARPSTPTAAFGPILRTALGQRLTRCSSVPCHLCVRWSRSKAKAPGQDPRKPIYDRTDPSDPLRIRPGAGPLDEVGQHREAEGPGLLGVELGAPDVVTLDCGGDVAAVITGGNGLGPDRWDEGVHEVHPRVGGKPGQDRRGPVPDRSQRVPLDLWALGPGGGPPDGARQHAEPGRPRALPRP